MNALSEQTEKRICHCELCWPDVAHDPTPVTNTEPESEDSAAPAPKDEEAAVAMAV